MLGGPQMIRLMFRILRVAEGYKGRIVTASVFAFLKSFMTNAPKMFGILMVASLLAGEATGMLCFISGVGMVITLILQCIFQYLADRFQGAAGYDIFAEKRIALGSHLRKLPMGYYTEGNIGKISSILSTDMTFIEENLMTVLGDLISYLFTALIFVIFMFCFNPAIGAAALIITLLLFAVGQGMTKAQMSHSENRQKASQAIAEAVIDFTEGIGIIKTYNILGEKSRALTKGFEEACKHNLEFEDSYSPWTRGINLIYGLGSTAMIVVSWFLFQNGTLSLVLFIGMLFFVFELFLPLKSFYSQIARLTVMDACLDRVDSLFDETQLDDSGKETLPEAGDAPEIEYRNVTFSYGGERTVLNDVSFTVRKNTMTALVGASGSGKSTIASLLPRFWDVQEGSILVRGKDIRKVPLAELMDNISMVFQRVYLFQDTVYNNISMGRPEASREEVIEAAKKARCYDFIMALPNGFDTVIGEGGASLSGGEQQRISIARCILKDAPIVILDEATASVDADNESQIQAAISELVKGKTLLVIAHRLHTIAGAEQILVIENGRIAEAGDHETLLAADGLYRKMIAAKAASRGFHH